MENNALRVCDMRRKLVCFAYLTVVANAKTVLKRPMREPQGWDTSFIIS